MKKLVGVALVIAAFGAFAGCGKEEGDDDTNGSGGTSGGTGGATVMGTGGAKAMGTGGGGAMLTGECAKADTSGTPAALHAAAVELIGVEKPCAFSGCHVGMPPAGTLVLGPVADLRAALVGKMSCESPNIPLVDGSGNEAALNNSWLWLKLTAPTTSTAGLTPQANWSPTPGLCGQTPAQKYGERMPWGQVEMANSEMRLSKIRNWICAGAPGPQ